MSKGKLERGGWSISFFLEDWPEMACGSRDDEMIRGEQFLGAAIVFCHSRSMEVVLEEAVN